MAANNRKPNAAGNTNKTGGSYKEKQPAQKPKTGKASETSVDEDGDGKADSSTNSQKNNRKKDKSLPE
jgi:hypothetical protein